MRLLIAGLALLVPAALRAEDALTPKQAIEKLGQKVVVEFEVKSATLAQSGICYLNTEANFRDEANLTIFIPKSVVEKFKAEKVDNPATHFKGKKVRISGTVSSHNNRPQIKIDNPDQVKLATPAPAPGAAPAPAAGAAKAPS